MNIGNRSVHVGVRIIIREIPPTMAHTFVKKCKNDTCCSANVTCKDVKEGRRETQPLKLIKGNQHKHVSKRYQQLMKTVTVPKIDAAIIIILVSIKVQIIHVFSKM